MSTEAQIVLWWLLFGATHILGSSVPVRTVLIGRLGTRGFKGAYSLVGLATFVPLCYVYFTDRHAGAALFQPAASLRPVTEMMMLLAFIVLAQGFSRPSPLTTQAEIEDEFPARARGIHRVTRHPMNLAFAIFGIAHMLSNPTAGDQIFFGGFVLFAILSSMHQDRRTLASGREEIASFQAETSALPFVAILKGKQPLAIREYSLGAFAAALVLTAILWSFHGRFFGGYGG